jgi:starch synthase (maltosyl-transferring)
MESVAREGTEEYVDNEKYQLRSWDLQRKDSLAPVIRRLNTIRRENPALQRNDTLVFHESDNASVLSYSKSDPETGNVVVCVVNLDPQHRHTAWLTLNLDALGVASSDVFQVHDLLSDARFQWHGGRAFVDLDPAVMPAHIFKVRRRLRSEATFEYFL